MHRVTATGPRRFATTRRQYAFSKNMKQMSRDLTYLLESRERGRLGNLGRRKVRLPERGNSDRPCRRRTEQIGADFVPVGCAQSIATYQHARESIPTVHSGTPSRFPVPKACPQGCPRSTLSVTREPASNAGSSAESSAVFPIDQRFSPGTQPNEPTKCFSLVVKAIVSIR